MTIDRIGFGLAGLASGVSIAEFGQGPTSSDGMNNAALQHGEQFIGGAA